MAGSPLELLRSPRKVTEVLVYLIGHDSAPVKKAIVDLDMSRGTFYSCVEKLRSLGFVFERKEIGYPIRAYYGLTRKGRAVAEHIAALAPVMAETEENLRRELDRLGRARRTRKNVEKQFEILEMFLEDHYNRGEWEQVLELARMSRGLASELADGSKLAAVELWIGRTLQKKNDDACIAHLNKSFRGASSAGDLALAAEAAYLRGCHHERKAMFEKAEKEFRTCERLATKVGSNPNLGLAQLGMGRMLVERGLHREAVERLDKARRLLEAERDREDLPAVYANLGSATFHDDMKEALGWHEKAIRACELEGLLRLQAFELGNASTCLQKLGDLKKARQYMARSVDLAEKVEDPKLSTSLLIQSASIDAALGELGDAEENVRKAIGIAEKNNLVRELANAHYLLGDILVKSRQPAGAKQSFEESLELFKRLKDEGMSQRLVSELGNLRK